MAPHTESAATTTATTTAATPPRVLVVFDFDESLVEEDSEVFFGKTLCPHLLGELVATLYSKGGVNSYLADSALGVFHERMPHITREQMRDAIARVPVSPKMIEAVKLVATQYNATVVIASDSNEFYINSMLDHTALADHVAEVHANKARWADATTNRLRVEPYHSADDEPHGCELCPTNLCKGRIIDALRKQNEYDMVLYVGDGRGDYCPSTRLTSRDTVFARADTASGRSFGLLQKINDAPHKVQARVVPWHSGDDIFEHFQKTLEAAAIA